VSEVYEEQAEAVSGVRQPSQGAAPYPLYGLPSLGQAEASTPFWKSPWFAYPAGAALGFGAGYLIFGWLMPRMKPRRNPRKNGEDV
jgi:hypothetical protein